MKSQYPERRIAASLSPPRNSDLLPAKGPQKGKPPPRNTDFLPTKGPQKGKWKPILGILLVAVILWQVVHTFRGGGKASTSNGRGQPVASSTPSASTAPAAPIPSSPPAHITIGGRPVLAGGQPILLLNPGLVAPGGGVSVQGSGFDPGSTVQVRLLATRGQGAVMARGKADKYGSIYTHFTLPYSMKGTSTTVVAQENGSSKSATSQLVTPAGIASVSIDGKAAGKPGDTVTVSATGFGPGEPVNVYWGRISGTPAATLTANSSGSINHASCPVGLAPVGPSTLVLVGTRTSATATAPYQMLGLYPDTTPHPYAIQAGRVMTYSGNGFAPNEQVLIYFNASAGMPALTAQASSTGSFRTSFYVPYGLLGRETLTAVGGQSRASVSTSFTVEPYMPNVQASTYGAMPGTSISFYASGFAANEVVRVYLGRGTGGGGQLVSAFRVNGRGDASAAGSYVIPGSASGALYFTLVGQTSGGTGVAKVGVTAPQFPVNVPPQPPYVLPPSLGGKPSSQPSSQPSAGSSPATNG
jgi:hypothetical protein